MCLTGSPAEIQISKAPVNEWTNLWARYYYYGQAVLFLRLRYIAILLPQRKGMGASKHGVNSFVMCEKLCSTRIYKGIFVFLIHTNDLPNITFNTNHNNITIVVLFADDPSVIVSNQNVTEI
jgi:hypothetical protein